MANPLLDTYYSLLNKDKKKHFGEVEQRVAVSAADFLGRQME